MSTQHNLPRQLTRFIGREHELEELARLLADAPLLTLTGTAGVGKTRLALELAGASIDRFEHGVRLVELAPLGDPAVLVSAIAAACALPGASAEMLADTLAERLQGSTLLLVLDNCEHLVDAVAEIVATLLQRCPRLKVLATSREPLDIDGEITWRVTPLGVPKFSNYARLTDVLESAAVRLFVDRARNVDPTFSVSEHNVPALARICIQLDGIPLALELAAALLEVLPPQEIAERLERDPLLLARSARRSSARHQTLEAAIEWSHDLLTEPQRVLLRRLAVFARGWPLEAAAAVCSDSLTVAAEDIMSLHTQLVHKSLVVAEARATTARFALLEPIRQYALRQLEVANERPILQSKHLAWYQALAEQSEAPGGGPDEVALLDRVELEHDNFRAALGWALGAAEFGAALTLAAALFRFWDRRGYLVEGCRWLEAALVCTDGASPAVVARALNGAAQLWCWRANYNRADELATQALAMCRETEDRRGVAWALLTRGTVADARGTTASATELFEMSAAAARRADDKVLVSLALQCLARARLWAHGPDELASDPNVESLALARQAGSRHAAGTALTTAGDFAWRRADADLALDLWMEGLELLRDVGYWRGFPALLLRLGWGMAAGGLYATAARLLGAAEIQRDLIDFPLRANEMREHALALTTIRAHLGSDELKHEWSTGAAMHRQAALAFALSMPRPKRPEAVSASTDRAPSGTLTQREAEVLRLVADGRTNRQIAVVLVLSPRTVKRHIDNIFDKLHVSSRAAAAMVAQRQGWL